MGNQYRGPDTGETDGKGLKGGVTAKEKSIGRSKWTEWVIKPYFQVIPPSHASARFH